MHPFPYLLALCVSGIAIVASSAQEETPSAKSVIAVGARMQRVATDFTFTEGPAWSPAGYLLFSDTRGNRVSRWSMETGVTTFLEPSGRANGLMFDAAGQLVACQGGERRLVRIDPETKEVKVLADAFDGKKLNSPNDLALDQGGGVYFTDPRYGDGGALEQEVMGVYYAPVEGALKRVIADLPRPNGVHVSPDGTALYVANPDLRQIMRYPIEGPGQLGAGEIWFTGDPELDGNGPDGMTIDEQGQVFAAYKSIVVLTPQAQLVQRIEFPEKPSNCCFGGRDMNTLFVTARTSLYALDLQVRGMGLPVKAVPTKKITTGSIDLLVPETWEFSAPTSNMRLGQFLVPGAAGTAELVVYYFGEQGAGGVRANIERWVGQFEEEGLQSALAKGQREKGTYVVVTCHGTYNEPIGPPVRRETRPMKGAAMIAIIVPTERGDHFFKLAGPAATVDAAARALRIAIGAQGPETPIELDGLGF